MSSIPTSDELAKDARWLVQAVGTEAGVARIVEMDREAYRQASFLDDRMFQIERNRMPVPWDVIDQASHLMNRRDARWIFHLSHVGSTLLSRLLGEVPNVLSIREPRFLRDVMPTSPSIRAKFLPTAQLLFSRTFAANEVAIVKTTSFVSEIASELVPVGGRALFMYVGANSFIPKMLAGENSKPELSYRAADRTLRLEKRGIVLPEARGDADLAAAAWACEMTSLEAAADVMPDRQIGWIDFDRMLADVLATLTSSAELLGFEATPEQLEAIAHGPLLGRYSKALEHEYSPGLRRHIIHQAKVRHEREIHGALAMLHAAAEKSPLLARALARSGES
ncbi:MAG TPA: hypothetical protein VJP82_01260 [Sphingomicrobium sp.]|jgi:hypothetical protein|nr:hypothetical protein [Sphingomicrobium sp.]